MISDNITQKIIGAAYTVYNQMGFGFLESVYHQAMLIELIKNGLKVESEMLLEVYYDDQIVGKFYADFYVDDNVVVELKSVQKITKEHEVQVVNYLNCVRKDVGLLINFGPTSVDVKRKYRNPVRQDEQD